MKNVDYDGSLKDDLELINNEDEEYSKLHKKHIFNIAVTFIPLFLITVLSFVVKKAWIIAVSMPSINNSYISRDEEIKKAKKERKERRKKAKKRVKEFIPELIETLEDNKKSSFSKTYDNIKDAVIIESTEVKERQIEFATYNFSDEDIDNYIKYIISDIYFLDAQDKIQVLRETKKVVKFTAYNDAYIKETKLDLFEDDDFPPQLPVEKMLVLRENED
ncbi:MAG: hypothetical protein J1F35_07090 [Erysipelotrichales bacterium]|nr:hypothetical protein [Erysipelotrichales bacterium]